MKKLGRLVVLLAVLALVASLFAPLTCGAQGSAKYMYPWIHGLRLRAEPSLQGEVLLLLKYGEKLTVTGDTVRGDGVPWTPVSVVRPGEGDAVVVKGYCSTYYLRGWLIRVLPYPSPTPAP